MSTNDTVYANLEPAEVWRHFASLNDIPRNSKHEDAARKYVRQTAQQNGASSRTDDYGNIVVYVPAKNADKSTFVLSFQSHLDMVCQHLPNVPLDPLKDGIKTEKKGNSITAKGTTLGADNGIGCAVMLALVTSPDLTHGPLELLFTVEEEIGLIGAANVDPSLLSSTTMVNLDSTTTSEVTVGCAGGEGVDIALDLSSQATSQTSCAQITVGGLIGGHSGVQIHQPRANATKVLTKVLLAAHKAGYNWQLCELHGGTVRNAIPRDASATIAISNEQKDQFQQFVQDQQQEIKKQYASDEPDLSITTTPQECKSTFDAASSLAAITLLDALPHGVQKMSERFEGKVETSCNLATAIIEGNTLKIHISSRSLIDSERDALNGRIIQQAQAAHASAERTENYPGWEPKQHSKLTEISASALENATGTKPTVEVIHAGVECGLIASKIPNLDVVSLGANIHNLHSPEESVEIDSFAVLWNAVKDILAKYA